MAYQKYSYELKKEMVELYFEGHSAEELAKKHNIGHRSRINEWVRAVRKAGTFDVLKPYQGQIIEKLPKEKKLSLEKENERLALENLYLKKLLELRKG